MSEINSFNDYTSKYNANVDYSISGCGSGGRALL